MEYQDSQPHETTFLHDKFNSILLLRYHLELPDDRWREYDPRCDQWKHDGNSTPPVLFEWLVDDWEAWEQRIRTGDSEVLVVRRCELNMMPEMGCWIGLLWTV